MYGTPGAGVGIGGGVGLAVTGGTDTAMIVGVTIAVIALAIGSFLFFRERYMRKHAFADMA